MRTNRDAAMTYVFVDEGGYAERALEPGGAVFGMVWDRRTELVRGRALKMGG